MATATVTCPETRRLQKRIPGLQKLEAVEQPPCQFCPLNDRFATMTRTDFEAGIAILRTAAGKAGKPLSPAGPCGSGRDELLRKGNGKNRPLRGHVEYADWRTFTPATRDVVQYAQRLANGRGSDHIESLDLLLGTIESQDPNVLAAIGERKPILAWMIAQMVLDRDELHTKEAKRRQRLEPIFTRFASRAIFTAALFARNSGGGRVEPWHVLLALLNRQDRDLCAAFVDAGVSRSSVRDKLSAILEGVSPAAH